MIVLYPVCYGSIGLDSISISLSLLKIQSMYSYIYRPLRLDTMCDLRTWSTSIKSTSCRRQPRPRRPSPVGSPQPASVPCTSPSLPEIPAQDHLHPLSAPSPSSSTVVAMVVAASSARHRVRGDPSLPAPPPRRPPPPRELVAAAATYARRPPVHHRHPFR